MFPFEDVLGCFGFGFAPDACASLWTAAGIMRSLVQFHLRGLVVYSTVYCIGKLQESMVNIFRPAGFHAINCLCQLAEFNFGQGVELKTKGQVGPRRC